MSEHDDEKVVIFPGVTSLPIPADRVLDNTPRDLQTVVIVGYDKDGGFYFSSSEPNGAEVLWLFEVAKFNLMTCQLGEEV